MYAQNSFKVLVGLLVIAAMVPAYGAVWYVAPDGSGDGASWGTAGSLQATVNAAAANDEVWVAAGTYTSTTDAVLDMKAGVRLYGGFAGTETTRGQRDWETNVTTIDGEKTRRCIMGASTMTLDGFTVANGFVGHEENGAGLYTENTALTLANCTFQGNNWCAKGSAIYINGGTIQITDCTFTGNRLFSVGTIYIEGESTATFTTCSFSKNSGSYGGAIYADSAAMITVRECSFVNNYASGEGRGGAIYCTTNEATYDCSLTVENSFFIDNHAQVGAAIWSGMYYTSNITDCEFIGNGCVAVYSAANLTLDRCSFINNERSVEKK